MKPFLYNSLLAVALVLSSSTNAGESLFLEATNHQILQSSIQAAATNALSPVISFSRLSEDWTCEIDFMAQTNIPERTWMVITNRVGAELHLWSIRGEELEITDPDAAAVLRIENESTVTKLIHGSFRPRNQRGMQWLHTEVGNPMAATVFRLRRVFGISFTNDYVLQITPLLYRVETNGVDAHLVKFPTVKLKLRSDGIIEKFE
ncbi:MAG TPA: hypothetical protein VFW05_10070 [Verrucomicrobiae bacterium]|nr:hypothetical protein [Verrucomicrobiae bacterium]